MFWLISYDYNQKGKILLRFLNWPWYYESQKIKKILQVIKQCSLKKRIMTRSQGFIQIFLLPVHSSQRSSIISIQASRPGRVLKMSRRFNGITTEKAKNNKYIVLGELWSSCTGSQCEIATDDKKR